MNENNRENAASLLLISMPTETNHYSMFNYIVICKELPLFNITNLLRCQTLLIQYFICLQGNYSLVSEGNLTEQRSNT